MTMVCSVNNKLALLQMLKADARLAPSLDVKPHPRECMLKVKVELGNLRRQDRVAP